MGLLLGLMIFLAAFGIWAFSCLPRAVIVPVHLAGGIATLTLLEWIALRLMAPTGEAGVNEAQNWRGFSRLGLVLAKIMLGGWVSSNFAAEAPWFNGDSICWRSAESFRWREVFPRLAFEGAGVDALGKSISGRRRWRA